MLSRSMTRLYIDNGDNGVRHEASWSSGVCFGIRNISNVFVRIFPAGRLTPGGLQE